MQKRLEMSWHVINEQTMDKLDTFVNMENKR